MPKIKIKNGEFEVEYEGDQKFINEGLIPLAKKFAESAAAASPQMPPKVAAVLNAGTGIHLTLSTTTIAQRLGAKSGSELGLAAVAHLAFVQKQDKFTQAEIHKDMTDAKGYYKSSHSNNMSKIVAKLVADKMINHLGGDNYALSVDGAKYLRGKLA